MKTQTLKDYPKDKTVYEHFADDSYYLFLEKHTFFLDVPHYHGSLEFLCILKGRTTVHLNGVAHDLCAGDIFLCNSQMVHFYENYEDDKLAIIAVLSEKYIRNFKEVYKNATLPSFLQNKEANVQIFELLEKWYGDKNRSILVDCSYANLLLDKVIKLYDVNFDSEADANNSLAIEFINYVNENYNKDISLETAAKHFGYSKEYFSKKFKQTVDKNFLSFVNTIRVQKALELLKDTKTKRSFMEICIACGFNNPTSLYRHLKKIGYNLSDKEDFDD